MNKKLYDAINENYEARQGRAILAADFIDGNSDLYLSGDMIGLIAVVGHIINRISQKSKTTWIEAYDLVYEMHKTGYKNTIKQLGLRSEPYREIKGDDYMAELREDAEKRANAKLVSMQTKLDRANKELEAITGALSNLKGSHDKEIAARDEQVQSLMKELRTAEHKCDTCILRNRGREE